MNKFFILYSLVLSSLVAAQCTYSFLGEEKTMKNGSKAYKECQTGFDGYITLTCTDNELQQDTTHCTETRTSLVSYGVDELVLYQNVEMEPITLRADGSFVSLSIQPAVLPEGLSFDPSDGKISGTPTTPFEKTQFTVTAKIDDATEDTVETNISLEVQILSCAAIDSFQTTSAGYMAVSNTGCPVGMVGEAKRQCGVDGRWSGNIDVSGCTVSPLAAVVYTALNTYRQEPAIAKPAYVQPDPSVTLTFSSTALPSGLTLDTHSGVISGVPTTTGTKSVTVTATTSKSGTTATKTSIFTITVNNAKCRGMRDANGAEVVRNHGETITQPCGDEYNGNSSFTCQNGVYTSEQRNSCRYKKPILFYPISIINIKTNEYFTTGAPHVTNVATYFEADGVPEGFEVDPITGALSGSSPVAIDRKYIRITGKNGQTQSDVYQLYLTVTAPVCSATADYNAINGNTIGRAVTYECEKSPEDKGFGFSGKSVRTCRLDSATNSAYWSHPNEYCLRDPDYMPLIISIIVFVVCLIFLIVVLIISNRKQKKTLPKSSQKKTTSGKVAAPKAPTKTTSKTITI